LVGQYSKFQEELTAELMSLLSNIQPVPAKYFDESDIRDLIQKAVDLKNDMTRENGIYVWYWLSADAAIENKFRQVRFRRRIRG
jgi:hypothetical protein